MKTRVIRNIRSADSPAHRQLRARDGMLPVGLDPYALTGRPQPKTCSLGRLWDGSEKSRMDAEAEALEQLIIQVGVTPRAIDLGRVWVGGMVSRLDAAGREAAGAPSDKVVDLSEVVGETRRLQSIFEETAGAQATPIAQAAAAIAVRDQLGRTRRAIARVGGGGRTRDARSTLTEFARISDEQRAMGPKLNEQAREFHARQSSPPTTRAIGDSSPSTKVRDLVAQANKLPPSREKYDLLAEAGRAQWSGA